MADQIRDILNNNRKQAVVNGQLVDTSEEELNSLAKASGSPTPATPIGANQLGAGEDSAKMAGTPGQVANAVRMNIQGQNDQATAQRTYQPNKQASTDDLQAQAAAQKLSKLGTLEGRVQDLVNQKFAPTTTQSTAAASAVPAVSADLLYADMPGTDKQTKWDTYAALQKIAGGTGAQADYATVAKGLGYTTATVADINKEVGKYFEPQDAQVSAQIAAAIPDKVTVGDLSGDQIKSMGFSGAAALANAVGVTKQQLQAMTVEQLGQQVQAIQQQKYSQSKELETKASDPALSEAERQQAVQDLRGLGAVGTQATEQDVDTLTKQVTNAPNITFNGQSMNINDALKDDFVKGTIQTYLTNPEAAATLKQNQPQFAQWIDQNQAALAQKVAGVSTKFSDFAAQQVKDSSINTVGDTTVPDSVMKTLYSDWGQFSTTPRTPKGVLTVLADTTVPKEYQAQLMSALDNLSSVNPGLSAKLANMNYKQLVDAGFSSPNDLQDYVAGERNRAVINSAPPGSLYSSLFPDMKQSDLQSLVTQVATQKKLGEIKNSEVPAIVKMLDADGDGKLDDPKSVQAALQKGLGTSKNATVHNMQISGLANPSQTLSDFTGKINAKDGIYNKIASFATDGKLDDKDLGQLVKQGISVDDLYKIKDNTSFLTNKPVFTAAVTAAVNRDLNAGVGPLGMTADQIRGLNLVGPQPADKQNLYDQLATKLQAMKKDKNYQLPYYQTSINDLLSHLRATNPNVNNPQFSKGSILAP